MRKRVAGTGQHRNTVIGFDSLIAQERPVGQLKSALTEGRIPNAFIFYGDEGVGKKTAARALAMTLNCDGRLADRGSSVHDTSARLLSCEPCGQCRACKKIMSGNHPDMYLVEPSGDQIRIDQIRTLCSRLALKPNEARVRVAVIACADRMNTRSANALLKELEEPPANTLFILTAQNSGGLLPTIISRCRPVRFNPISQPRLKSFLVSRHHLDSSKAGIVATLADGSVTRALSIKNEDWDAYRGWIIDALDRLSKRLPGQRVLFVAALGAKKSEVKYALAIMKTWYRDLSVFDHDPGALANPDLEKRIKMTSIEYDQNTLIKNIEAIEDCERAIQANANLLLTLDALTIKLSGTYQMSREQNRI